MPTLEWIGKSKVINHHAKTMCFDLNEGVQEDFRPVTPSNDAE